MAVAAFSDAEFVCRLAKQNKRESGGNGRMTPPRRSFDPPDKNISLTRAWTGDPGGGGLSVSQPWPILVILFVWLFGGRRRHYQLTNYVRVPPSLPCIRSFARYWLVD